MAEALAAKQELKCRDFTGYVNGGYIGVNRAYAEFALVWSALMEELERDGADLKEMKNWTGKPAFSRMDQDVLNATIMATNTPIALLGSEAMGMFPWANVVMPHAMFQKTLEPEISSRRTSRLPARSQLTSPIRSLSTVLSAHSTFKLVGKKSKCELRT